MESRVNDPPHYTQGPIHCIDAMISAFGTDAVVTFCLLNAFKYMWRSTTHERGVVENVQKGMYYMKKASELKQVHLRAHTHDPEQDPSIPITQSGLSKSDW